MRPLAVTPISPAGRENAYANGATRSGQQTTTGHGVPGIDPRIETCHSETQSPHAVSGSGQKTATAPCASGHKKRAKRTTTGVDALDLEPRTGRGARATTTAKPTSYSYVTWPSYPSMLHDPEIENHGRITRGGKTTQSPSNSHVVEHAVRIGERQRSRRRGKRESTASGQLPLRPLPKEKEKRERAPDDNLEAPPPLSLDLDRAGGEEAPPRQNTRCTLRPLPLPLPS